MSSPIPVPGEKHATATVFVFSDEHPTRLLLMHHKKFDRWMPPGGHQELLENPYEAAIREVHEETGVDVSAAFSSPIELDAQSRILPLPRFVLEESIAAYGDKPAHFHIDSVYAVRVPHQSPTHQQAEAHDAGWFTKEELATLPLFDNVRTMALDLFSEFS